MDEPTSGLDAAAASSIMTFLKELAVDANLMILATIHQPSTAVFHGFDKTMVLTGGEVCYSGPAAKMVSYLARINKEVRPTHPLDGGGPCSCRCCRRKP
eukprot:scaffold5846_cov333-Prasinococcus_capsulatus_cf.AAC.6